jgi:threonine dehydrogenase-like Zn-dependent dehydrogenase
MKAVLFDDQIRLVDLPRPVPARGEALVRVRMAGICNTDIELSRGYMGFRGVPGHEFVGVVEECGNDRLLGKRVVGEINCVCGTCTFCARELPHHCPHRTVLGILDRPGAFAEYLTLPEQNLHVVPDPLPDEIAVFTEPVAAAFRIHEQIEVLSNDRVVVLGDGKLGLLIAQVMRLKTKDVLCIGKHADKLNTVASLGIATAQINGPPADAGADIVVEATGSADGLRRALQLVRPEGTIVLKTTVAHETPLDFSLPVINEIRILGSRCGPFRPALESLALGTVDVRPLIHATYPLSGAVVALEHAQRPGVLKVLIRIGE